LGLGLNLDCFAAEKPEPAKLKVSGYGLLGSRELRRMLLQSEQGRQPPEFFDADFIEDAALQLSARLIRDGYLKPRVTGSFLLSDASTLTHDWQEDAMPQLPRPMAVRAAHFEVQRGILYFYQDVAFSGLTALNDHEAQGYFLDVDSLIRPKSSRVYTPLRLRQSIDALAAALDRKGLGKSKIKVQELALNDADGAVRLTIAVEEAPVAKVRSLVLATVPASEKPTQSKSAEPFGPVASTLYSQEWRRALEQRLQRDRFREGHPDATARLAISQSEIVDDVEHLDLLATEEPGPKIRTGRIRYEGNQHTHESVLERRVDVPEGESLNRMRVEQARARLFRLGIFDSIRVRYDTVDATTRDVVYELDESKRREFSLLLGYGSYELLRGGIEWQQRNVFGLAHASRLRLIQSFKATSAEYAYTMPEVIVDGLDAFLTGTGLRREEPSFLREEYGGAAGLRRHFPSIASDATLRYNFEFLNAVDPDIALPESVQRSRVASFITDLRHDRRDHPLYPQRGYHALVTAEAASPALGGQADFQRLTINTSWHRDLGGGSLLHVGLSHGVNLTLGGSSEDLPFNKRFMPGGENSVRGYRQGEASPKDEQGHLVGAETFLEGHIEFEQALTRSWSVVGFLDTVCFAKDLANYPGDTVLYSVGLGIRWRTLLGPVRLEYGHNLNPRPGDPSGTLHFSIGFPF